MLNCNNYKSGVIDVEKYVKVLKEKNLKVTPQRLEVLRYLDNHMTHPTVEQIYSDLKRKNPALSKTTVYNTLELLKEKGLVNALTISSSEQHFDIVIGMHHHFLCENCNKIVDIEVECPYIEKIMRGGHRIDEVHGYFKGICEACLRKVKKGG